MSLPRFDPNKKLQSQIQDILEAIDASESFVEDMDFNQFSGDQKTIYAIERSLGIVGTTAKRLPWELVNNYSEINWREIMGLGEKLTFGLFEVDIADLWRVLQDDLPKLKQLMVEIQSEMNTTD
ncbi:MAG: HepT-like ribonuclease domain-containing protein [Pseudanabaenaceae cyanobacterium bins.68]|nr:HepT-like ribonuclease domain-containing protein [Pseudanabaenaceae cyanobacterium bins.68]